MKKEKDVSPTCVCALADELHFLAQKEWVPSGHPVGTAQTFNCHKMCQGSWEQNQMLATYNSDIS